MAGAAQPRPYVDGPLASTFFGDVSLASAVICPACRCEQKPAGHDDIRFVRLLISSARSKRWSGYGMSGSAVRRESITSLRACQIPEPCAAAGCFDSTDGRRLAPVQFAGRHDRPGDARQFVGERHGDEPSRSTLEKLPSPDGKRIGALVEPPKARSRPEHEQSPEIGIALFGDPAEPVLSAARVLSRNQAEPGRKVAAGSKRRRIRRMSDERRAD